MFPRPRSLLLSALTGCLGLLFAASGYATTPKVVSGGYHSLLLKPDGAVYAWGVNDYGQVGDGTTTNRPSAQHVAGLAGVTAVAANWRHSLALKRDGTVWAWGANYLGQLGDGTETDRYRPIKVLNLGGVIAVAAGAGHSVAVKSDGTVLSWGTNGSGQLGDGTNTNHPSPVSVSGLTGVAAVAAGNSHTLALKSDGTVWSWGWNGDGELGDGTTANRSSPVAIPGLANVMAVAAGPTYSFAVMNDGTVLAWGANYGTSPAAVAGVSGVVAVAAGGYHDLAMRGDGSIVALRSGASGSGAVTNLYDAVAIAAGDGFSVVIRRDGTVWGSGLNTDGRLGDGTRFNRTNVVPVAFGSLGYVALANGGGNSVALSADGKVWGWGGSNGFSVTPRSQIQNLTGVDKVAAGELFSLARKTDGTVMAWGANYFCQLGNGGSTSYALGPVVGLTNISAIAGGYVHSLAVKADGTVYAWGTNGNGQLGDGTTAQQCTPVQVAGLTGASNAAAGYGHSIALKTDGTVWAWGAGNLGQIGDGTTTGRANALAVPGLYSVAAVAAGGYHNLAVKLDGTVWAWGTNSNGELGDGTTTQRNSPVQVTGLTDVVAVAAGYRHSMALKSDGTVWAWGGNSSGQIGIGNAVNQLTPVQVNNLTDIRVISSNSTSTQSMALRADGTILVWGNNAQSTLGDGTYSNRLTPVPLDDFFPASNALPANWIPTAGALSAWTVAADSPYAGTQALKSGTVGTSAHSGITYTTNFRDGFVSFQRKVSSELNADYLRFYVDGVMKGEWSGEQDWASAGIFVAAGVHDVAWKYEKNGSAGSDAVWIDSVILPTAFPDVPASSFAFDYINAIKDAGITTGCGSGNYCPTTNVTRDQMAAFIIRAVEGEPAACASPPFPDVPISNSFCKYVKRMLDRNITTGCGSGNYCPSQNVTRDQMAAFIVRAVEGEPLANYCGSTAPFADVPAANGFCRYIKRLSELGVTTGCGNDNYCPTQTVTRDQMAAFLARAFLGM